MSVHKNYIVSLDVEVVYCPAAKPVFHGRVSYYTGMTVGEALQQAGVLLHYPETATMPIGIFATRVTLTTVVKPGDRIEIYRPLLIDPKEKRRQRAQK